MKPRTPLMLAALAVLALCFRTAAAFNGGLWRDEALFLDVISLPSWTDIVRALETVESHPPLFYAMMRVWRDAFGHSDMVALLLPILLGGMCVVAAFFVGRSLFTERAGLVAAALVALSPPLVEHGSTVRPYSLLALLVMVSTWCFFDALDRGGMRRWAGYAIATLASVYTHNWMWIAFAGQLCAGAVWFVRRPMSRAGAWRGYLVAIVIVAIWYAPWFATLLSQARSAGHSPLRAGAPDEWLLLFGYAIVSLIEATVIPMPLNGRQIVLAASLVAFVVLARSYALKAATIPWTVRNEPIQAQMRIPAVYLLITATAAFLIATIVSIRSNLIPPQCLMILGPLLLLAIGSWLDQMIVEARNRQTQLGGVFAIGIVLGGAYLAGQYDLVTRPRSNAREIALFLSSHIEPDDLVIIMPGWLASSVSHYQPATPNQIEYPAQEPQSIFGFAGLRSRFADPKALELTLRRIENTAAKGGRVWLVSDRDGAVPTAMDSVIAGQHMRTSIAAILVREIEAKLADSYPMVRSSGTLLPQKARREELTAKLFSR